jgi:V-type H+-transporting ATPase subunit D
VNAIEHVIIPKLDNTIKYINSELDEMDRYVRQKIAVSIADCLSEEFFRLKKVQGKKKRDAEATENQRAQQNAEFEAEGGEVHRDEGIGGGAGGGGDMLDEGKDEDVIF